MSRASIIALYVVAFTSPAFSQDKKTEIDLDSPEKAAKTIHVLWLPVVQAAKSNNELAATAGRKKLDEAMTALAGTTIDWNLKVTSVKKEGISFRNTDFRDKAIILVNVHPFDPNDKTVGRDKQAMPKRKPFPAPNEPWVVNLKFGDNVRVQGKLSATARVDGPTPASLVIGIMISDAKLSPAK